jgi:Intracellular proteinase inhibitor
MAHLDRVGMVGDAHPTRSAQINDRQTDPRLIGVTPGLMTDPHGLAVLGVDSALHGDPDAGYYRARPARPDEALLDGLSGNDPGMDPEPQGGRTMRPATRLSVEILEGKALLSGVAAIGPELSTSLTVDRSAYKLGQPVVLTFTETNASHHDVTVDHGPANQGFVASRNGQVVWQSNAGLGPQFLQSEVLHPGQSIQIQATWDGRSEAGRPLQGTFVIHDELAPTGSSATVTIGVHPATPPRPIDRLH